MFCISFNSTFKLLKQSVTIAYNEIDDIGEEDETEKKEKVSKSSLQSVLGFFLLWV